MTARRRKVGQVLPDAKVIAQSFCQAQPDLPGLFDAIEDCGQLHLGRVGNERLWLFIAPTIIANPTPWMHRQQFPFLEKTPKVRYAGPMIQQQNHPLIRVKNQKTWKQNQQNA